MIETEDQYMMFLLISRDVNENFVHKAKQIGLPEWKNEMLALENEGFEKAINEELFN